MEGTRFIESFLEDPDLLFENLARSTPWYTRMSTRKTISYGLAYNYSQMFYAYLEIPPAVSAVMQKVAEVLGFEPNNCLINFYPDGKSRMGYHADQTDLLAAETGIAILSLGATRILRFRNIINQETKHDFSLPAGSLFYMSQEVQQYWQHSIPPGLTEQGRMSLTFRKIAGSGI